MDPDSTEPLQDAKRWAHSGEIWYRTTIRVAGVTLRGNGISWVTSASSLGLRVTG